MIYAFVMLITINGQADSYTLDTLTTASACAAELQHAKPAPLYRGQGVDARVSYRCVRRPAHGQR